MYLLHQKKLLYWSKENYCIDYLKRKLYNENIIAVLIISCLPYLSCLHLCAACRWRPVVVVSLSKCLPPISTADCLTLSAHRWMWNAECHYIFYPVPPLVLCILHSPFPENLSSNVVLVNCHFTARRLHSLLYICKQMSWPRNLNADCSFIQWRTVLSGYMCCVVSVALIVSKISTVFVLEH